MNAINNKILLLTGCINPQGMSLTALQNPVIRKTQYISALKFYAENTRIPIVFVENTNTDISREFSTADCSNRIEFITFNGNDFDRNKGKGYGEALMIEYALRNSAILNNSSFVIKVTGRLLIDNFDELIREMQLSNCVYANLVRGNCGLERKSYFFGAPIVFLIDYFISRKEEIDESKKVYFERHLYNECIKWSEDGGKVKEFRHPILVSGISGSTGKAYPREKFPYIKAWLRFYLHKLPIYKDL